MNNQVKKLVIYARQECHLCEEMISILQSLQRITDFKLEIIDIDLEPDLVSLYNDRIPVLFAPDESRELCHYHLDLPSVNHFLAKS